MKTLSNMKEPPKAAPAAAGKKNKALMLALPVIVAVLLLLVPVPSGLEPYAWHFFAIFVGVIVGLIFEPLPGAVIGLTGVVVIALFSQFLLFSPTELANPTFKLATESFKWAVSGFGNSTVWLIFGAFMFAAGYDKTQFGRRLALILVKYLGRRSLTLGYAITFADLLLAPFTPSNTARSGGTIYPIIANLPPLYGSKPNDPSARKIGSYLMWVAITAACITSSMFLSALAPNLLALALVKSVIGFDISWGMWFLAFIPLGLLLILTMPLLAYWFYPPEVKVNDEVPRWAMAELEKLGKLTRNEILLLVFVVCALLMWIFATAWIEPAMAALLVIILMLWTGVLNWNDITSNKAAWNTFAWFATLVALADGLARVGFIAWLGKEGGILLQGYDPQISAVVLLIAFFLLHYLFASTTAHTTALLPAMLTIAASIPGINMPVFCLMLCTSLGVMGIITPYGTGPSPIYYGSGYLPTKDYWRLGTIFGAIFLIAMMLIAYPWMVWMF
ncbi:DASS family sodium-coupled anion symporter [Pantoea sp. BS_4]|uniref:Citrate:succinate antiporter n=1 Tax=Pantoea stewartii TaxID=66269 RepID=A0AB34VDB7_9GAMM|nr:MULTISPECIES: DASS family sodium-coupled anion symporter [Pantoea]KKW52306.1 citrate:succinate antiporter [Pantoea ananatis]KHE01019.1 citrate:succinate antiporter [Pantoea stewartii]KHN63314.1 citrate:succinate antiporter [Pantoea stewartii]KTS26282.1 citrate:succinate antiporter [Pantoea stewartii]KTS73566.1 citrate:succinate antiporter [Pantoea stewartii]